jgi:hypothetical protein
MSTFKKTMFRDRNLVAWLLVIVIAVLYVRPIGIPLVISPSVRAWYTFDTTLGPASKPALISVDYTTGTIPEGQPALTVITKDLMKRGVAMVFVGFGTPDATSLMQTVFDSVGIAKIYKYGVNYVGIGYIPGGEVAIATLATEFQNVAKTDAYGTSTANLQLTKNIKNHEDFSAVFGFDTTNSYIFWIRNWAVPYKIPLYQYITAQNMPQIASYFAVGQVQGYMGGIPGAAQYEALSGFLGDAIRSTDVLSMTHIIAILLIVGGNILYFTRRGKRKKG